MLLNRIIVFSMERAKSGIRAKIRKDGYQTVHFEEYPGHWIATPEKDRLKALAWAKRNRSMEGIQEKMDKARGK
jgi:hypothetical protein